MPIITRDEFAATRLKLGLTQYELARLLDVRAETVCRWEKSRTLTTVPAVLVSAYRDAIKKFAKTKLKVAATHARKAADMPSGEGALWLLWTLVAMRDETKGG